MISLLTIKNFLTSKVGLYILVSLLIAGSYIYAYQKGYSSAKYDADILYTKELNEALQKQSLKQQEAIKKAVETANKDKDIEIKWKEKKVYIDKIVEKTIYKECVMPEEDKKVFSEAWDSIK